MPRPLLFDIICNVSKRASLEQRWLKCDHRRCRMTAYEIRRFIRSCRCLVICAGSWRPRAGAGAEESETAFAEVRHPLHHAELQRGARCAVYLLPRAGRFFGGHESEK